MAELSQAEFGRVARGASINPGNPPDVEWFILGMRQSAIAAVRRVHSQSPDDARAYFQGKASGFYLQGGAAAATARSYRDCIERYIAWDGQAATAEATPTKGIEVRFSPDHVVRARPDVVLGGPGTYEARVLLWDDLPLGPDAAELIALPAVGYVESEFGKDKAAPVSVWQLATSDRESVGPAAAEGRRSDVEALLAQI
jgi:hypothetical protein